MLATIVDTTALLETIAASFAIGIGVTVCFSVAIYSAARFTDLARDGRNAAAVSFGIVGILALLVCGAAIVLGIVVMTHK